MSPRASESLLSKWTTWKRVFPRRFYFFIRLRGFFLMKRKMQQLQTVGAGLGRVKPGHLSSRWRRPHVLQLFTGAEHWVTKRRRKINSNWCGSRYAGFRVSRSRARCEVNQPGCELGKKKSFPMALAFPKQHICESSFGFFSLVRTRIYISLENGSTLLSCCSLPCWLNWVHWQRRTSFHSKRDEGIYILRML